MVYGEQDNIEGLCGLRRCGLLNHWIVSAEGSSSLIQNLMQIHCSTQSLPMQWPHSTPVPSKVSTTPTNQYSEVIIVHACVFQSTVLASRLHRCCKNHSCYINSGWTFSGQTSYNESRTNGICLWRLYVKWQKKRKKKNTKVFGLESNEVFFENGSNNIMFVYPQ